MVAIDMCGKHPITGEWIYGIMGKHALAFIFFVFFVCFFKFFYLFVCLKLNIFTFLCLKCLIFVS